MRIAVPSDDGRNIAGHFGRAAGFLRFDVEGDAVSAAQTLDNTFTAHGRGECTGGEEHHHDEHHSHEPIIQALAGCQVLFCRGIGGRAIVDLEAHGIKVVCVDWDGPAEEGVRAWLDGRLKAVASPGCGHH